ncbi:hypothetical protein [Bacillus sp. S3]|uniref:hypothetical protein n=1 Tax=Bacillus sp. S3 TaxID=486398 RepID=UPI0016802C02|nr:hypothetical protein [Bacillus sp. S3]
MSASDSACDPSHGSSNDPSDENKVDSKERIQNPKADIHMDGCRKKGMAQIGTYCF